MSHIDPRYCRDYLHGSCDRVNCRYEHATVAELMGRGEDVGRLIFCRDFQRSNCFRPSGTCRFIHATSRDEQYYRDQKMLPPHLLHNLPSSISLTLLYPSRSAMQLQEQFIIPPAMHGLGNAMHTTMPGQPILAAPQQQHGLHNTAMMPPQYAVGGDQVHGGFPMQHVAPVNTQPAMITAQPSAGMNALSNHRSPPPPPSHTAVPHHHVPAGPNQSVYSTQHMQPFQPMLHGVHYGNPAAPTMPRTAVYGGTFIPAQQQQQQQLPLQSVVHHGQQVSGIPANGTVYISGYQARPRIKTAHFEPKQHVRTTAFTGSNMPVMPDLVTTAQDRNNLVNSGVESVKHFQSSEYRERKVSDDVSDDQQQQQPLPPGVITVGKAAYGGAVDPSISSQVTDAFEQLNINSSVNEHGGVVSDNDRSPVAVVDASSAEEVLA